MRRLESEPVTLTRGLLRSVEKPARYVGGEIGSTVKTADVAIRFAYAFPDLYEIGMSNLALRILYHVLNEREDTWCERCFAPWTDMEEKMRAAGLPLFTLESKTPLAAFDFIGFSLQYELSFTQVLNMLDLGGVPLLSRDRGENDPLVIAGGPVVFNLEPMADVFDLALLGEAEGTLGELLDLYRAQTDSGFGRERFLRLAAKIEGVYVPSLYEPVYRPDGTLEKVRCKEEDAPKTVRKRILSDLDKAPFPAQDLVPSTQVVHDRMFLELMRGCPRGCRFCQAGMIYRPLRQKSVAALTRQAEALQEGTGYDELGLLSLSTSDYGKLGELTDELLCRLTPQKTSLSLPSLRLDSFSLELMQKASSTRKTGLTFAPEAGSQRLRNVINKQIEQEDLLEAMRLAFSGGYSGAKLYFMLGLPTETLEDVTAIESLVLQIRELYLAQPKEKRRRRLSLTVSVAVFVPKPHTPFQWAGQENRQSVQEKIDFLRARLRPLGVKLQWHDLQTSYLEAVLARGDRRLLPALLFAWRRGQTFAAWDEHFDFAAWQDAFAACDIDPDFYALRPRQEEEVFPWEHLDSGVRKSFLRREWQRALDEATTPECRLQCDACGATCFEGGVCLEHRQN